MPASAWATPPTPATRSSASTRSKATRPPPPCAARARAASARSRSRPTIRSAPRDYLDQAVDAGDTDASTLGLLADAYWRSGSHDEARTALAKAIAQDPRNPDLVRLGRTIK